MCILCYPFFFDILPLKVINSKHKIYIRLSTFWFTIYNVGCLHIVLSYIYEDIYSTFHKMLPDGAAYPSARLPKFLCRSKKKKKKKTSLPLQPSSIILWSTDSRFLPTVSLYKLCVCVCLHTYTLFFMEIKSINKLKKNNNKNQTLKQI